MSFLSRDRAVEEHQRRANVVAAQARFSDQCQVSKASRLHTGIGADDKPNSPHGFHHTKQEHSPESESHTVNSAIGCIPNPDQPYERCLGIINALEHAHTCVVCRDSPVELSATSTGVSIHVALAAGMPGPAELRWSLAQLDTCKLMLHACSHLHKAQHAKAA